MITNRDLDRQLASWFETRATSIPPDALLERAILRVSATRQRPGWFVSDRWRSSDGRARPTSTPARVVLVLVTLLVIALAATAVGAWLTRPSTVIVPPPPPVIVASPSPSEAALSPAERPTPTPGNARPVPTSTFAELSDFLPVSDTVAWASTPAGLYRTTDTGETWTDVAPPNWSAKTAVSLVDADTVYLASGGSPGTITATHDGGASWLGARIDVGPSYGGPVFLFQTPVRGFATFYDLNDKDPMHVYGTTDGGVTWTGPKDGKVPHLEASMDKLYPPIGGFLWQSGGGSDNKRFDNRFFLSTDGGAIWTQYTFPIDGALAPKNAMKQIEGILREDDGRILLEISADGGRNPIPNSIYESAADTATWRPVMTLPDTFGVQFLSSTDWVLTSQNALSEVRSTSDAGAHWRITKASTSIYDLIDYQFATPETGWATEECRYASPPVSYCDARGHAKVLLVTTDGGATWTRIGQ